MNTRQRLFATEYIKNGKIGYQAVYAAGYHQGYNAACVTASRLLRKANIKAMIDDVHQRALTAADLTEERVKKEIATIAFSKVNQVDSAAKMKGLDLATKVLGMQSTTVQTVEPVNTVALTFLSRRISKLSTKTGKDAKLVEFELQTELSDTTDEDYSPDLDASVHPEVWPSGSLLGQNIEQIEQITEIGDQ